MPSSNNHDHNVTEITATVMVQTEAALKRMMEYTADDWRSHRQACPADDAAKGDCGCPCQRAGRYVLPLSCRRLSPWQHRVLTMLHPSSHPRSWMSCARVPNSVASSLCKSEG